MSVAQERLNQILPSWYELLTKWSLDGSLRAAAQEALMLNGTPEALQDLVNQWGVGDFSDLPPIVLLSSADINGAMGAYAISTGTIYINADWLVGASEEQVQAVLTEELGHHLDGILNAVDTPGDEGEYFALLISGNQIPASKLLSIQNSSDNGEIRISSGVIAVENASSVVTSVWMKSFGTTSTEAGTALILPDGRIAFSGVTTGGSLWGANKGGYDGIFAIFDQSLNPVVTDQFGNSGDNEANLLIYDQKTLSLSIYGHTRGILEGANPGGELDLFVQHRSMSDGGRTGGFQKGTWTDDITTNAQYLDGDIYVAGYTENLLYQQDSPTNNTTWDAYVARYTREGVLIWGKQFGFSGGDSAKVLVANTGDILLAYGNTAGNYNNWFPTVNDPTLRAYRASDGTLLWTETSKNLWAIAPNGSGIPGTNALVTGSFIPGSTTAWLMGSTTGDYFGQNKGSSDIYLQKIDAINGSILKTLTIGTDGEDSAAHLGGVIALDNQYLLLGGMTKGSFAAYYPEFEGSFGGGSVYGDIWIGIYDTYNNKFVWGSQFGGAGDESFGKLEISQDLSTILICGVTDGTFDGVSTIGGGDVFLRKIVFPGSILNLFRSDSGAGQVGNIGSNSIGGLKEGDTLSAPLVTGDPDGDSSNPNYTFQWYKDGGMITLNGTSNTYLVPNRGAGYYKVAITYTDAKGFMATVESAAALISPSNNGKASFSISGPAVAGAPTVGETLTAATSSDDADGNGTFAYAWQTYSGSSWTTVGTNASYQVVAADEGKPIQLVVSYKDQQGFDEVVTTSAGTIPFVNNGNGTAGSITSNGLFQQGSVLTAPAVAGDPDGTAADPKYSYKWLRSDISTPIGSANTYTLTSEDVGKTITVEITYTDFQGFIATVTSPATPTITGPAKLIGDANSNPDLVGTDGNDRMSGQGVPSNGQDLLDGRGGIDTVYESGDYNFTISGSPSGSSTLVGSKTQKVGSKNITTVYINDAMTSIEGVEVTGGASVNTITAQSYSGQSTMNGGGGNDVMIGGTGVDWMTGGLGADFFRFAVKPSTLTASTADHITDFKSSESDKVQVSRSAFGITSSTNVSFTATSTTQSLSQALATTNLFVLDSGSGELYFNANGSTAGAGTTGGIFAILEKTNNVLPAFSASSLALI